MTWSAVMLGGPDDGRTFEGPGDYPPPVLRVALPRPQTRDDFVRCDDHGPVVEPVGFDTVECHRHRYSDGRWLFVWPTGSTS